MESSIVSSSRWTGARRTAATAALWLVALLSGAGSTLSAPTLRYQTDLNGDFALIGNTLAWDCRSGAVTPVVGTVGACGNNTSDTGVDVYWRSQSPGAGQATANTGVSGAQNRSTAVLGLPAGATIAYARLYWSAFRTTADTTATLEALGPAASLSVTADQSFTASQAAQNRHYYQSTADVTDFVRTHGAGAYRVSGVAMANPGNADEETNYSAWSLVVLFEAVEQPLRNLAVFDGLDLVTPGNPASTTIDGFQVPNAGFDAKLGAITYEGDQSVAGDALSFGGATLSDAQNPAANFFNGTRSWAGGAVTVEGDLPQLAGTPGSMSGFDLDVLDVTARLVAGQTSAAVVASTTTDVFLLGAFVTSISTLKPDFSTTSKTVEDVDGGGVLIGDVLQYTVVVPNVGNDPAVATVLTDALPLGVTFVPGSLTITEGANAGVKTDAAGDDQGEYVEATRTLVARLGIGADASQGGTLGTGASTTVTFQVTYDGTVPGTLRNQAVVTATGAAGAPPADWPSDGNGGGDGQPPTEIEPDSDGDGDLDSTDCGPLDPTTYHGAPDVECNGVDNDCDGSTDEDFASTPTVCGVGPCASSGATACVGGLTLDSCTPGTPAPSDATCDGLDEDCSGVPDDDYVPVSVTCGVGGCERTALSACVDGGETQACEPGQPALEVCNGVDDDCNGKTDAADGSALLANDQPLCEKQAGVCQGAKKTLAFCSGGAWKPCNDAVYRYWAPVHEAVEGPDCDGQDNDCDDATDEAFEPAATTCGVGACARAGLGSCVAGVVTDSCEPGAPLAADDVTCDGLDDDCSGEVDEDYVPDASCFLPGACAAGNEASSCAGGVEAGCASGVPLAADDATCDGVDDDCSGEVDEDYVRDASCFLPGACAAGNVASSCVGGVDVACVPGVPVVFDDATCDGVDDDCDGAVDDEVTTVATSCGVGACAAAGVTSCEGGATVDSCVPGEPVDEACDGLDNSCDGLTDEGFDDSDGDTLADCVDPDDDGDGDVDETDCAPLDSAVHHGRAEICNSVDDNCVDGVDEGFSDVNGDGLADCEVGDTDGDGLDDTTEIEVGTDPLDADTDDDGLADGAEAGLDDGYATDPTKADSDGDGLPDGLEQGVTEPVPGGTSEGTGLAYVGTDPEGFSPDADPLTTTDPTDVDTDAGTVWDGVEDANHDGAVDQGETDPLDPSDDVPDLDADDDGDPDETDCAPEDPTVFHGQLEVCNGIDDDCDGATDGDVCAKPDSDDDGDPDETDCAPEDPAIFHGQVEICNGIDDTCDAAIDEGFTNTDGDDQADCVDADDDDDGDPDATDCARLDPAIGHGATEVCNGRDDDCDGKIDGAVCALPDADDDGDPDEIDCAPDDAAIHHGADEVCNGVDDDCDGATDDDACTPGDADGDGDGVSDDLDNCPTTANPDQADLDEDGTGDLCQAEGFSLTGGSCAMGGMGSSGFAWWLILALALGVMVLGRQSLRGRLVATALLLLSVLVGAPLGRAEPMIDANRFKPSPFFQDGFGVESAEVRSPYRWNLGLFVHYQNDPLILRSDAGPELRTVLGHQLMADLMGAYRFADFLAVGVALPVVLFQDGQGFGGADKPEKAGVGDLRIHPRLTFLRLGDGLFALAFEPVITLPTGRLTGRFAGRPNVTFQPQLDASLFLGLVDVSLNVGYLLTRNETAAGLPLEDELLVKLGARVKVLPDKLDLLAEVSGAARVSHPFSTSRQTPVEVLGGGLWHAMPGLDVAFGGGSGLTEGYAAPDFRLFAGVRWAPAPAPVVVEEPDPDTDGDGLKDSVDECPLEPEDRDGFEDADGCPEPDDDKDGILDPWVAKQGLTEKYKAIGYGSDGCPDVAEDADYVDDDDGCPEPDNDGDGLCDPWVEERGQQATYASACHGNDKCLMEPETVNGFEDDDGCPDSKVEVKGNKLIILDVILFYVNEARIQEESFVILDSVASVLTKEPGITKVRVEGHTDTRGNAGVNQKLSEARAKAVMDALVQRGVEASRLGYKGYGESRPLVKIEKDEADFQKNRRVEFTILE